MSASCPRLGFTLRVVLHPDTKPRTVVQLREALTALVASRGLTLRLGGTIRHWSHLLWRDGSQAEHADREVVRAWIAAQPQVTSCEVGALVDLDE